MIRLNRLGGVVTLVAVATAVGCSSSSSSNTVQLTSAVQNLSLDAAGTTTVLTFDSYPGVVTTAQLRADGDQGATSVSQDGSVVYVTWDERVTPRHRVRILSGLDVSNSWMHVVTSDDSAPTFVVQSASQDTSDNLLGGDSITLMFSGPRVIETQAEDTSNWLLTASGNTLDLTGSTFEYEPTTGQVQVTLGAGANLHSTFELSATSLNSVADVTLASAAVSGVATGDTSAPMLVSTEQNLAADPLGRVVDLIFDEPMDPIVSAATGRFTVNDHPASSTVTLASAVGQPDAVTLRVTFTGPVVPSLDTLTHSGLVDSHGNFLAGGTIAVGNTSAVPNTIVSAEANSVANIGGDTVVLTTSQALDPDLALDPAGWNLNVATVPVDLSLQQLEYDLLTATLTVTLMTFDMHNGDAVDLTGVSQVDIDGDAYSASTSGVTVTGDLVPPSVANVTQNRADDPTGHTIDVEFGEDVDAVEAENIANYTFSPANVVVSADLQLDDNTVRLVVTDVAVPGDYTLTVAASIRDIAGNIMGTPSGPLALLSTDTSAPSVLAAVAAAIEGADNDAIAVVFNDDLIQSEIETHANWTFESPVGSPWSLTTETLEYDPVTRVARLTLDIGGQALTGGDEFSVAFTTVRDIAGNTIDPGSFVGNVSAEEIRPEAQLAWVDVSGDATKLNVRFSEPSGPFDDLYSPVTNPAGTMFFVIRDAAGAVRGYPISATSLAGGLGVQVDFGFVITVSDTLDVIGLSDLAGNVMFPAIMIPINDKDPLVPTMGLAPPLTAMVGERNDEIEVTFGSPMSPWQVTNPANYRVRTTPGGVEVDLDQSGFDFDGNDTLSIRLNGFTEQDLAAAESYEVSLMLTGDPLRTAQGVELPAQEDLVTAVSGDTTTGPSQLTSVAVLDQGDPNSVFVIFDEAVDESLVEVPANYDYNGGNIATGTSLISPRVVQVTFGVPVAVAGTLDIDQTSVVDLAGNATPGGISLAIASDLASPSLVSVAGESTSGSGGDMVRIRFTEQVDMITALDPASYLITNGGPVGFGSTAMVWDSVTATVSISLDGVELDATQALTVQVSGVADVSGNVMGTPILLGGTISGDSTAPTLASAFVNYDADPSGRMIDVRFSEAVQTGFAGDTLNWDTSGTPMVLAIDWQSGDHLRILLDAPMGVGEELQLDAGLSDLAGNVSAALSIDPVDPLN